MTSPRTAAASGYSTSTSFPPGTAGPPVGPYLIPVGFPGTYTAPLVIWVAALCAPNTKTGNAITPSTGQPAFTMDYATAPSGNDPSMFAKVSIDPTFAFSADSAVRARLQASFTAFRAQLEALEVPPGGTGGGLVAGGSALVANRVATNMPLRFDEILWYYYSFTPASQYVDLLPGMTLRMEWSGYQYGDGPNGAGYALNGFVGAGTARFVVTRRPDQTLALDAFLGALVPGYVLNTTGDCPLYAGGLLDLALAANARRYLRLFLPTTIAGAGSLDNGGTWVQSGSRLIGADTLADLQAATTAVLAGQSGCGTAGTGNQPVVSIVFNGRVVAVPELSYMLAGAPATVPLGTTLRNVVERIADPAPAQLYGGTSGSNLYVTLSRWTQRPTTPTGLGQNGYVRVNVAFAPPAGAPLGDSFDLPLVKGDVVQFPNMSADLASEQS